AHSTRELLEPLKDLFAAIFFVYFGLRTDPQALPPVLIFAAALAIVGMVTKVLTGRFAALRAGVGKVGAWRAGALLIPRGEFSIVIAGLAVTSPGVPPELGPFVAAYVLILVIIGPLAVRVVEPTAKRFIKRRARRAAVAE
ncbi:MAG: cation:proton antiporter, partial [Stackebrandtia sp.]